MKRTKSNHNRFSGPELAEVLIQVQAEHGDEAPIRAVNKVRSGGIGGFFAREEFEIIVDPDRAPSATSRESAPEALPEASTEPSPDADERYLSADARFRAMIEQRLVERDEALRDVARAHAPRNHVPPAQLPPVADDLHVREDVDVEVEDEMVPEPVPDIVVEVEPAAEPEFLVEPKPVVEPEIAAVPVPVAEPVAPGPLPGSPPMPLPGFWGRLEAARGELQGRLTSSAGIVCVVGPLRDTMGVARQLQHRRRSAPSPVYVLTTRAEIVSEPGWELVRDGGRLVRLVAAGDGEPAVVVIDVPAEHPIWLAPLIQRLRTAGAGLVRHTVVGSVTAERIESCERVAGGSWELDLPMAIDPVHLMDLLDDGVAVSTVGGADLGPELLVALRREAQQGALRREAQVATRREVGRG